MEELSKVAAVLVCRELPFKEKNQHRLDGAEVKKDWQAQTSLELSGPWFPC